MDQQASDTGESLHRRHALVERGASLVEYALLIALIAIVALGAVEYFGANVATNLSRSASSVESAG